MDPNDLMIADEDWLFAVRHIVAAKRMPDENGKTATVVAYLDHPFIESTIFTGEQAQAVWDWLMENKGICFSNAGLTTPDGCGKRAFFDFLTMYAAFLRTGVKITDVDPDSATIELQCPDGTREWHCLDAAAEILAAHHRYPGEEV